MRLNPCNPCCTKTPCECCALDEDDESTLVGTTFSATVDGFANGIPEPPEEGDYNYMVVDLESLNAEYNFGPDDYGECVNQNVGCAVSGTLSGDDMNITATYHTYVDGVEEGDPVEVSVEVRLGFMLWYDTEAKQRGLRFWINIGIVNYPDGLRSLPAWSYYWDVSENSEERYTCNALSAVNLPNYNLSADLPEDYPGTLEPVTVSISSSA